MLGTAVRQAGSRAVPAKATLGQLVSFCEDYGRDHAGLVAQTTCGDSNDFIIQAPIRGNDIINEYEAMTVI